MVIESLVQYLQSLYKCHISVISFQYNLIYIYTRLALQASLVQHGRCLDAVDVLLWSSFMKSLGGHNI